MFEQRSVGTLIYFRRRERRKERAKESEKKDDNGEGDETSRKYEFFSRRRRLPRFWRASDNEIPMIDRTNEYSCEKERVRMLVRGGKAKRGGNRGEDSLTELLSAVTSQKPTVSSSSSLSTFRICKQGGKRGSGSINVRWEGRVLLFVWEKRSSHVDCL